MKKVEKINFFLIFIIIGTMVGDLYSDLSAPLIRYGKEALFFLLLILGEALLAAMYIRLTEIVPFKMKYFIKYALLGIAASFFAFILFYLGAKTAFKF